ncbi:MAG: nucleotidyltransferase family protein [Eubacterium sp.]|nr:nucleotidyltransferase family protein [Eubacterium sp.]
MNNNEKYFVTLISSHLNNIPPAPPADIDWEEIFNLSNIHNVCAITANQILLLDKEFQPEAQILSKFRQQLGYTLIDSDGKEKALSYLKSLLSENEIEFILVKGAILKELYPIKELRTSSDIDVIVKNNDLERLRSVLNENADCIITNDTEKEVSFSYIEQNIEVHSTLDTDNTYFEKIFDMCEKRGYEYKISNEDHLLYVLCHIIKHFSAFGAGIKMFMDIDVIIRNTDDIDYNKFIEKCRQINIETFAKASLALCHSWFDTPVATEIDLSSDFKLKELFENEIISSGNFGYSKRNTGDYYINKEMNKNGKNNLSTKLKALITLFFPSMDYLKNHYRYSAKCPLLLPIAWLSRLLSAVFKRNKQSKNTIRTILNSGAESEQYKQLLNELNV